MGQLCSTNEHSVPMAIAQASADSATIIPRPLPPISASPPNRRALTNESSPKTSEMMSPRGTDGIEANDINIRMSKSYSSSDNMNDINGHTNANSNSGINNGIANGITSPMSNGDVIKLEPLSPVTESSAPKPNASLHHHMNDTAEYGAHLIPSSERAQMLRLMMVLSEYRTAMNIAAIASTTTTTTVQDNNNNNSSVNELQPPHQSHHQPSLSVSSIGSDFSSPKSSSSSSSSLPHSLSSSSLSSSDHSRSSSIASLPEAMSSSTTATATAAATAAADRQRRKSDREKKAAEKKRRAAHDAEVLRLKMEEDERLFAAACAEEAKQIAPLDNGVTFIRKFGSKGTGDGQFRIPIDVAIGPSSGDLYIVDKLNNRIQIFSATGDFKRSFGNIGADALSEPFGIAFLARQITHDKSDNGNGNDDGYVILSEDAPTNRISVWDSLTYERIRVIGGSSASSVEFNRPCGLATLAPSSSEPLGIIYVCDMMNNRICLIRGDGSIIRHLGGTTGTCQLQWPQGVAVSPDGRLLMVSDTASSRVIGISAMDGRMVASLARASPPTELGQGGGGALRHPQRIIVGPDQLVYVADTGHHRIQVFAANGRLMSGFGNPYHGSFNDYSRRFQRAGDLRFPSSVAVAKDGTITVCDTSNNRIQQFRLGALLVTNASSSPSPSSPAASASSTSPSSITYGSSFMGLPRSSSSSSSSSVTSPTNTVTSPNRSTTSPNNSSNNSSDTNGVTLLSVV